MTNDEIDAVVLEVLAGQSPGYVSLPDSSAFVAAGLALIDPRVVPNPLTPDAVRNALNRLATNGLAVQSDDGWIVSELGLTSL